MSPEWAAAHPEPWAQGTEAVCGDAGITQSGGSLSRGLELDAGLKSWLPTACELGQAT